MSSLNQATFQAIINLLIPYCQNPGSREAWIRSALFGCEALNQIEWTGAAREFTFRLVQQLLLFGECEPGKNTLVMLLDGLKAEVGSDKQAQIDQLIAQIPVGEVAEPAEGWQVPEALQSVNVFISYARKDGYERSERLYKDLQAKGIAAWRDIQLLDPTVDFTGEIEAAIDNATHVVVIITPDVKRADSFVRLEITYALTKNKPIIPLMFEGGHRPITIINHTYIDFRDWNKGFAALMERLTDFEVDEVDPQTQRERELAYLQSVGQQYEHWRDLYTDMAATARFEEPKVKLKAAAKRYLEVGHSIYPKIDHSMDAEQGMTVKVETFDELREALRKYKRVALIGDPGAGKTTTLERLAYEYATSAAEEDSNPYQAPLPLFVRLGAYTGGNFETFLGTFLTGLSLADYLPHRLFLLLDGLNEMPPEHLGKVQSWIQDNPDVALIVSCRKLDYVERKLPLQRVDVAPLDLERIRLFMSNYLEAEDLEKLFWGLAGHEARRAWDWYRRKKADAAYSDFFHAEDEPGANYIPERKMLDALRKQVLDHAHEPMKALPDMLGVVTNPFLMKIVIEIYALQGEPPTNKGALFSQFVDLLLKERGKLAQRPDRQWVAEHLQKQALAALAYRMQVEKTGTSVEPAFVLEMFRQAVPEVQPELLLYFAVSASILEQTATVRFSHQLLQEYFAAYEMGEDMRRGVPATKYFPTDDWWQPTGWEESAILLAGMEGNATRVVQWLTPVQPDLAYKVATESGAPCSDAAFNDLYQPPSWARRSPYALADWGLKSADNDPRRGVSFIKQEVGAGLPEIVWGKEIPAGRYAIGGDKAAYSPLEKKTYSTRYAYHLAKYIVTIAQFQAFVDALDGIQSDRWWHNLEVDKIPHGQTHTYANYPCRNLTWHQAVAFCRWLTAKYQEIEFLTTDKEIRLPTEREWEIAARYPDGRLFPWGNEYCVGAANCDEREDSAGPYFLNRTTAVGLYENGKHPELDLYDLSGNLFEWTLTKWGEEDINEIDGSGNRRVLRGGSWLDVTRDIRAASRYYLFANQHNLNVGFRLCLAPVGSLEQAP
jgi:formylglycine-generating enzyme required for sulfatase activity